VPYLIIAEIVAAALVPAGEAVGKSSPGPTPPSPAPRSVDRGVQIMMRVHLTGAPSGPLDGDLGPIVYPAGCRDVDVYASQSSWIFHTTIYRFHQFKHWCWRAGGVYGERHAWQFDGSATACLNTVYPPNAWYFTWWRGISSSGHISEERAHVTNCIFHIGDWKEFYPDVKIWAYADGSYKVATAN
jgi:hypothetical protein